jgi:hypothetical protein
VHAAAACDTVNVCDAIVSVPLRVDAAGLAATENETDPLPLPVAPPVTVIQPALLVADQGHPASEVTSVDPVSPPAAAERLLDEIENVHPAPACVTVKVCPATVMVPLRCVVLPFAVALKPTLPEPLPLAPLLTVSHPVLLLVAAHVHPAGEVTFVEPVAAPAPTAWLPGEMEYVQAAPACVTLKVWPPIVNVPVR